MLPCLYLIVPCYNEEEVIISTLKKLNETLESLINSQQIANHSQLVFVDDGSTDCTWNLLEEAYSTYPRLNVIKLSQNRGHQIALWAGYEFSHDKSDITITLDADLQDDISVLGDFVAAYQKGADIVYGVRNDRTSDTWFKRTTAEGYYSFMQKMGVDLVYNHADYRLLSNRALSALLHYQERNLFIRGLVPVLGFKTEVVYYKRGIREAGVSKYPFKRMINFALEGITSFSVVPLRYITKIGIFIICLSFCYVSYILFKHFTHQTVSGWSSLITSIWFLGGLQLFSLGIIGEYVGNVYREAKQRPHYFKDMLLTARIENECEVS